MIMLWEDPLLFWSLVLVFGFPLLMILFTEMADRLERRNHPLAASLRHTRNLILPVLAALLVMQFVLGLDKTPVVRLVATIFWLAVLVIIFSGLRHLLAPADAPVDWRQSVPSLLLQLPRFLLALAIIYYILAAVWRVDVAGLITALGVGSLVIALALQDALSNLFSGLLLLIHRPFQVGDWIRTGDVEGRVHEINWRTSMIRTRDNDLIMIPNGVMAKTLLKNYSRPTRLHRVVEEFTFHIDSPPNQVRRVLEACALSTPGVLADPAPDARTVGYEDHRIRYKIMFWIEDYGPVAHVRNRFMTRIYYQARRQGLKWPAPTHAHFHFAGTTMDTDTAATDETKRAALRAVSLFAELTDPEIETLAAAAEQLDFGQDETILHTGESERGIYLLHQGSAVIQIADLTEAEEAIAQLSEGDFFGETGLFGRSLSAVSVVAQDDVRVLFLPRQAMTDVVEAHSYVAAEMNALIQARKKQLDRALSTDETRARTSSNGPVPSGNRV